MKTTSKIIIIFTIFSMNCIQRDKERKEEYQDKATISIKQKIVYAYKLDPLDSNSIGIPENINFEIGPTSLIINSNKLYFIDMLFARIKSIDIETGLLSSSKKISGNKQPWLRDIIHFNDRLFVSSDLENIYILNENLFLVDSLSLPKDKKYFFLNNSNNFVIYLRNSGEKYLIDKSNRISNNVSYDKSDYSKLIFKSYLGKKFNIDGDIVTFGDFNIQLDETIQNLNSEYYESKNVAFNSNYFSHFKINNSRDTITFYIYVLSDN